MDSVSYGDVNQLAEEAYNSAIGRLGADAMPNLFAAYPENAYRIDVFGQACGPESIFSEDELKEGIPGGFSSGLQLRRELWA